MFAPQKERWGGFLCMLMSGWGWCVCRVEREGERGGGCVRGRNCVARKGREGWVWGFRC